MYDATQVPIDKKHLYDTTLPTTDGDNTRLDVLLDYAKDVVHLNFTNLCAGPNGLGRRPGGSEMALLQERTEAPIFVVRAATCLAALCLRRHSSSFLPQPSLIVCCRRNARHN